MTDGQDVLAGFVLKKNNRRKYHAETSVNVLLKLRNIMRTKLKNAVVILFVVAKIHLHFYQLIVDV